MPGSWFPREFFWAAGGFRRSSGPAAGFYKPTKKAPTPFGPGASAKVFRINSRPDLPRGDPRVRTLRRRDANHSHAPAQTRRRVEGSKESAAPRHISPNLRAGRGLEWARMNLQCGWMSHATGIAPP